MSIPTVRQLWAWINILSQGTDFSDLLLVCQEVLSDFSNQEYCFPSRITAGFAKEILSFSMEMDPDQQQYFKLTDLLNAIYNNARNDNPQIAQNIKKKNNELQIMLHDVVLFRALTLMHSISHGRMLYQLNACVLLDAMIIKPDRGMESENDLVALLFEVSEKAKLCEGTLETKIIWTVAMLNYKVHQYENAIYFFQKFIKEQSTERMDDARILRAKIYIGYCYEKSTKFDEAIILFESTLSELQERPNISEAEHVIIRELHHGLGHFYNERAVFAQPIQTSDDRFDDDILNARYHMEQALAEKVDYYSCYGALFHEYGDYWTAKLIFDHASELPEIRNNGELSNELSFYRAQTRASLAKKDDKLVEEAEKEFDRFEEYCKSTYNFDGIVHARVFKIRTFLRSIAFSSRNNKARKKRTQVFDRWHEELTQYTLSSYASKSIRQEYEKTICVLKIFKTLYADALPVWHMPDLLYYFKKYMELMPATVQNLDDPLEEIDGSANTNLYQIAFDNLQVWCIGSVSMSGKHFEECMSPFGINCKIFPVTEADQGKARSTISGNWKPDLVMVLPPNEKDDGFEHEIDLLISNAASNVVLESYSVFNTNSGGMYNKHWFEEKIRKVNPRHKCFPAQNELDALLSAYCLRSFEILRKELLQPIPLFSLAPTHFSKSYDFQLGEKLDFLDIVSAKNEKHRDEIDSKRYNILTSVDDKYSTTWLNKALQRIKDIDKGSICAEGSLVIFCPKPNQLKGMDSYIGYSVRRRFNEGTYHFPGFVRPGVFYTAKTLPSYSKDFWDLEKAIEEEAYPCDFDQSDDCTIYRGETLLPGSDQCIIASICRKIISVVIGKENDVNPVLDKPFCCIRKVDHETVEEDSLSVFIILDSNGENTNSCCERKEEDKEMNKEHPSVFVTYAWESSENASEDDKYLKEVAGFVNELRKNGYNATYDRAMFKDTHNWTEIMTKGLQMDRIIVLLSPEYKKKADDFVKNHGVKDERNGIKKRLAENPGSVILAKLPSQKECTPDQVLPVMYSGEHVIDLASQKLTDGLNLLYRTLAGKSITGEMVEVSDYINEGKEIR